MSTSEDEVTPADTLGPDAALIARLRAFPNSDGNLATADRIEALTITVSEDLKYQRQLEARLARAEECIERAKGRWVGPDSYPSGVAAVYMYEDLTAYDVAKEASDG